MEHTEIVQKVRDILNEHGGDDGLSIATDRVLLDEYIESAIPDAVIILAQKGYRVNVAPASGSATPDIQIPDDFINLLSLKVGTWIKGVTKIAEPGSPEYFFAHNGFTPPGVNTPVCYREGGKIVCMPVGDTDTYTMEYNAGYSTGLEAEAKEAVAVCYMAAALVLGMFGDDQGKQRLSDIATNMLQ